jgi:hypothetical protein
LWSENLPREAQLRRPGSAVGFCTAPGVRGLLSPVRGKNSFDSACPASSREADCGRRLSSRSRDSARSNSRICDQLFNAKSDTSVYATSGNNNGGRVAPIARRPPHGRQPANTWWVQSRCISIEPETPSGRPALPLPSPCVLPAGAPTFASRSSGRLI